MSNVSNATVSILFLFLLIWIQENHGTCERCNNLIIPWPATITTIDESCWCGGGGVANSQQQPDYFNVLYRTALCVADPSAAGWAAVAGGAAGGGPGRGAGAGVQGYNTLGSVGSSHRAGGHTAASRQHTQRTQRGSNTDQSRVCTVLVTGSGEVPSTVT